jgi:hypothetical protein
MLLTVPEGWMTLMVLRVLIAASYSYIMLIEPASKVSVPLFVAMRTRSRVPESVTDPPPTLVPGNDDTIDEQQAHKFEPMYAIVMTPDKDSAATEPLLSPNPFA